ncbi:hypothetical protein SKAU_G00094330 [Synaphobranchus kaupii]|uniref:DNA helicase n=1 Tax=Synaphobranchus kaupii TaxID=118154 RepID=A0A9Q1J4M6_SYNKA|nr:hypothetical protein SKAU_G00094330 [Synaphobranchus kaupii]
MLYMLDLWLREITLQPNKIFGGLAMFFFGDLMQLKPCQARYIFDEPQCPDYKLAFHIQSHWEQFEVITLEENHRQGEDHGYADILNRLRVGHQTEEDLAVLRTRIRPDTVGATYISCTDATVNKQNNLRLDELKTELLEIGAINHHPAILNFKPKVSSKGTVGNSAFLQTLRVKVGARVMLIHNLDTFDCLTNDSRGTLAAVIKDKLGSVIKMMIMFDEECQGAYKRRSQPQLQLKYPGCTPIEKVQFTYSLSKKQTQASSTATVYQFPLVVCYAATCHKFQGQEIAKPQKSAMDFRTVFQPAMGYVMLSRVPSLEQLHIIDSLPEANLYVDLNAMMELRRMESVSVTHVTLMTQKDNPPMREIRRIAQVAWETVAHSGDKRDEDPKVLATQSSSNVPLEPEDSVVSILKNTAPYASQDHSSHHDSVKGRWKGGQNKPQGGDIHHLTGGEKGDNGYFSHQEKNAGGSLHS